MKRILWTLAAAGALALGGVDPSAATPPASDLTFEMFRDARQEFRWRLKAGNGRTLAVSDEGYTTRAACMKGIELIKDGAAKADVEDHTAESK